ncbi:hypothetical protein JW906_06875 [bacterium]|nr:hypothetical protein [bacterium]
MGHESYLWTQYPSRPGFRDEDLCLHLPFASGSATRYIRSLVREKSIRPSYFRRVDTAGIPEWKPSHPVEALLLRLRDSLWEPAVRKALEKINIRSFDILFLDGGMDFLRSGRIAGELKSAGLKCAVGYFGSDLRTRGVIRAADCLADYRFTVEYDHTLLYPGIDFHFFPFALPGFPLPAPRTSGRVRIGHSPTNRRIKGSDEIIAAVQELQRHYPVEMVLIEGLPKQEALSLKKSCDLFIDAIGELGYGISGLEAMAMGIPTAAEILPDFEKRLGDHPFINLSRGSIVQDLIPFIASAGLRRERGERSRRWVLEHHDPVRVAEAILEKMGFSSGNRRIRPSGRQADSSGENTAPQRGNGMGAGRRKRVTA